MYFYESILTVYTSETTCTGSCDTEMYHSDRVTIPRTHIFSNKIKSFWIYLFMFFFFVCLVFLGPVFNVLLRFFLFFFFLPGSICIFFHPDRCNNTFGCPPPATEPNMLELVHVEQTGHAPWSCRYLRIAKKKKSKRRGVAVTYGAFVCQSSHV